MTEAGEAVERTAAPAQGRLKIYLGGAPGAGKTYAMLREGHRLREHGRDVVVGYVETYSRPRTVELLEGLDVIPRRTVPYRGTQLEEMDLDALLARRPEIALVDELAHTNAPGLRHQKRWQDVEELRAAGISVISTVNVQHVESVKDLVEKVAGVPVRETVPDRMLDSADVLQFIDITPEALRSRMRHGNVYGKHRVDPALANFFRPRNLAAMREIALRLVADSMARSRKIVGPPEHVLVAISCGSASEELMRRGSRLARKRGGSCVVMTVDAEPDCPPDVDRYRHLAETLGCSFVVVRNRDVAQAVIQAAHDAEAEHVILGEVGTRGGLARLRPTLIDRVIDGLPDADIHVISRFAPGEAAERAREPQQDPAAFLRELECEGRRRGVFRAYLGYGPGCGATTTMLDEARRRAGRGTDVVVGAYRVHGDPAPALAGLEVPGGRKTLGVERRLCVDDVLARNPEVVVVDDLAQPAADGRLCMDHVPRLLAAGIVVLATLHAHSIRGDARALDTVLARPLARPVIDDRLVDVIDELEVVDLPPAELVQRVREQEVLPPAELGQALQGELRLPVLDMLRESVLRRIAEHADRQFIGLGGESVARSAPELRNRIVLCLSPQPGLEERIRQTAQYAAASDARLFVVTVRPKRLSDEDKVMLGGYATLTHQLHGEFVRLEGRPVAPTLARFIGEQHATEVVLGHRRRSAWKPWDTSSELIRLLQDVDVHILRASMPTSPPALANSHEGGATLGSGRLAAEGVPSGSGYSQLRRLKMT